MAIQITDDLTIYTAAEMKNRLLELLKSNKQLELDLSQVSEMDTAGLQILIMLKRECQLQGGELKLSRHSPAVLDVLDLCQMTPYFGDPVVISSQAH